MSDSQWDAKLKGFLKKTGEDFKRFGSDVKQEAQKLLTDVKDPERQQKLREGLKEVGTWARKTAEEVATFVETGVKKAEDALVKPAGAAAPPAAPPEAVPAPDQTPPSPPPEMDDAPAPKPRKTVGKGAPKKRPAARGTAAKKKTIGKKPPPAE